MRRLLEALDRFLEAARHVRIRRSLRPLEQKLERAMAMAFRRQGQDFLRRFESLKRLFPEPDLAEAIRKSDWEPLFAAAATATIRLFVEPLDGAAAKAVKAGATALLADIGLELAFDLGNPRAVQYLRQYGAARVTKVNETTRDILRGIISRGVEAGESYDQMAREIKQQFSEFAVGRPQEHIDSRAHLVAVTEMANAYEEGNRIVAQDLAAAGLEMERRWETVGDERVSDGCQENEDAGWIPLEDAFPSGDERPPRFPGCRCHAAYRRKRE